MPTDFITYAQNAEDVMLWRALQHVERGFYIDVGAQDPVVDSVTKAFYERGWRGINIEPVERWYQRLAEDRPHDINLQVATSDHIGELVLFNVEDTGLSTSDPDLAKRYIDAGKTVSAVAIGCRTLDDICAEYDIGTVHFLKIDCEGAERPTLKGISLERVRPWIILVESTEPNSTKATHLQWEHLLVDRGYSFVYFDGLNRFYLANAHEELREAFSVPPTPAEWKERAAIIFAQQRIDHLSEQLAQMASVERLTRAESERDHWYAQTQHWINENSRRETVLSELRSTVDALHLESRGLAGEIARLQRDAASEIARLQREVATLVGQHTTDERARHELQSQLAESVASTHNLQHEIAQIHASHSWILTAPLRGARRGAGRVAKILLRPPARALRPALRQLSGNPISRKLVVALLGHDSALLGLARLFLFGPAPAPSAAESPELRSDASDDDGPANESFAYSHRQRMVLRTLRDARARGGKIDGRHDTCV